MRPAAVTRRQVRAARPWRQSDSTPTEHPGAPQPLPGAPAPAAGTAYARALVWFRRDLRCADHAALHHALNAARQVWCVFVYDRDILAPLPRADRRVEFLHASVASLDRQLQALGAAQGHRGVRLIVRDGQARQEIAQLATALRVQAVYFNHDDDPGALRRDRQVSAALGEAGVATHSFKDQTIFERGEVLTAAGTPYTVFTPYKNSWLKKLQPCDLTAHPVQEDAGRLAPVPAELARELPTLRQLGFEPTDLATLGVHGGSENARRVLQDFLPRIDAYADTRDFPAVNGTSSLSVHLRFGTLSVREVARAAWQRTQDRGDAAARGASTWLSELIWRDFYHQVLHHHPQVMDGCFKPSFDRIEWEQGPQADALFQAWCEGRTGYPLVDAAMAQLNRTGYMHNRLRMVTASFLTKDLGIDWRWGERYFAQHLNDFDLAANNGGWQWAASTGCDAQPWFRIFNPVRQSEKFDPAAAFIRRHLPQLAALPDAAIHAPWTARPIDLAAAGVVLGKHYPWPVVEHEQARLRTLARYQRLTPA
jgi:deoxyribodipyrimidine photo-lyase